MARLQVLPAALTAAARAVRDAAPDSPPVPFEVGHAGLSAALADHLDAWSDALLVAAVQDCAQSLADGARAYAQVESLLVPRALR